MSEPHERHLSKIIFQASELIESKYRKGQQEHGGTLWDKPGLIDEALNEVTDLMVYLLTLKEQLGNSRKFEVVDNSLDKTDENVMINK